MQRTRIVAKTVLRLAAGVVLLSAASPLILCWAITQGGGDIRYP